MAPALLLAVMLLPVGGGLLATLLPAFGDLPGLPPAWGLQSWRDLLAAPGLRGAVVLTVTTGLAATALSLAIALLVAAACRRARVLRLAQAAIAPLLATPHASLAIGFAFLVAPSGWIARLLSPWLTGWARPPDIATVQDAHGVALVLGLCLKEVPYLLLMSFAALGQAQPEAALRQAAMLGYGPARAWVFAVLPRIWPQLRLPVLAVLAFSLSVVDVALILGPSDPPTLAVLVLRGFAAPDLALWRPAAAGAVLLALLVLAAVGLVLMAEVGAAAAGRTILRRGLRGGAGQGADAAAIAAGGATGLAGLLSLSVLALWSAAAVWRFPAPLPQAWGLGVWRAQASDLLGPAATTLWLGGAATLLALGLTVTCLEHERARGPIRFGMAVLYAPLLVPQIGFLFGLQMILVRLRLDGGALALVWAHLVFVAPYVFLVLVDPSRALDPRYARTALCLGASPSRVLLRVTLPLLARPLAAAAAVGFAVSAGLYLPTLFAGAGRFTTLTTQAVALAGGGDRRITAATALLQAALPLAGYALAMLPRRRG